MSNRNLDKAAETRKSIEEIEPLMETSAYTSSSIIQNPIPKTEQLC